jgi:hypothetical protein
MDRISIAFFAASLVTSHLAAQGFIERNFGVRENLGGGICFPAPYYQNCSYDDNNYSNVGMYRLWRFHTAWNRAEELERPQANYAIRLSDPPAPTAPPPTPVVHEYHWPDQGNTSATFSIVTDSGAEYLATMVWVDGETLRFHSADGGTRQLPLTSVSRHLTQIANARKDLKLPLPSAEAGELASADSTAGSNPTSQLQGKRN